MFQPKGFDLLDIVFADLTPGRQLRAAATVTAALLARIVETVRNSDASPVFLYLPIAEEISLGPDAPLAGEAYLLEQCAELDVPCLSLREALQRDRPTWAAFDPERHWTAQMHQSAASAIVPFLRAQLAQRPSLEGERAPKP
jgi:hypothetical protein